MPDSDWLQIADDDVEYDYTDPYGYEGATSYQPDEGSYMSANDEEYTQGYQDPYWFEGALAEEGATVDEEGNVWNAEGQMYDPAWEDDGSEGAWSWQAEVEEDDDNWWDGVWGWAKDFFDSDDLWNLLGGVATGFMGSSKKQSRPKTVAKRGGGGGGGRKEPVKHFGSGEKTTGSGGLKRIV